MHNNRELDRNFACVTGTPWRCRLQVEFYVFSVLVKLPPCLPNMPFVPVWLVQPAPTLCRRQTSVFILGIESGTRQVCWHDVLGSVRLGYVTCTGDELTVRAGVTCLVLTVQKHHFQKDNTWSLKYKTRSFIIPTLILLMYCCVYYTHIIIVILIKC
jgi:hypothetical protein